MRYFTDDKDGFYAIEDDSLKVPDNYVQINEEDASALMPQPSVPTTAELLAETDQYMSRVTEDTVVNLLTKGTVTKSDYPQIVWDRINYRRSLRNQQPI